MSILGVRHGLVVRPIRCDHQPAFWGSGDLDMIIGADVGPKNPNIVVGARRGGQYNIREAALWYSGTMLSGKPKVSTSWTVCSDRFEANRDEETPSY